MALESAPQAVETVIAISACSTSLRVNLGCCNACSTFVLMYGLGLLGFTDRGMRRGPAGVLIGSGMGGLTIFQDGVKNLVEKGYKKITPFFIPYAITNMCGPCSFEVCCDNGNTALIAR